MVLVGRKEGAYGEFGAVVSVLVLLRVELVEAADVKARCVRAADHIVEEFEGDFFKCLGLLQQFDEELVCFVWGEKVMDDGAGRVLGNILGVV